MLLGSASPELIRDSSESLAGRIAYHHLSPFHITEVEHSFVMYDLWIKGGFPKMLYSKTERLAHRWMENFINTYLNRDLLQLGLNASPKIIRNLWSMTAYLNGQLFNASTLAKSLGVTVPTVKRYVDFLEEAFLLRSLHPYTHNMSKRLVKSPKVYLTDTGILHFFNGINSLDQLSGHPLLGSSWESFVINQIIATKDNSVNVYFYRTHQGAEMDLVFARGYTVVATIEIKYTNSPQLSKGNYIAIEDLGSTKNFVITPSSDDYMLKNNIRVCSLNKFINTYLHNV